MMKCGTLFEIMKYAAQIRILPLTLQLIAYSHFFTAGSEFTFLTEVS
jgi:hypothetical protein